METFTQPKITGYRQLSDAEAALMNEGKALAEACGAYIAKLREHANTSFGAPAGAVQVDGMLRSTSAGSASAPRSCSKASWP